MKYSQFNLLAVILFLLFSCKKEGSVSYDTDMTIKVVNGQGKDLLNSPAMYNNNNIVVSHVFDENLFPYTTGKTFTINSKNGINTLVVFPTTPMPTSKARSTITLIKFGTSNVDTIKSEFRIEGNATRCDKVWYNGELKYDSSNKIDKASRHFTIAK